MKPQDLGELSIYHNKAHSFVPKDLEGEAFGLYFLKVIRM